MPHNSTSPGRAERDAAARELRERAAALRELASRCKPDGVLEHWATQRAQQLESVAEWMPVPFGLCDSCGMQLEHFTSENVGAVLCPSCDGEMVAELVDQYVTCDGCQKPYTAQACRRRLARNGATLITCPACYEFEKCAVCARARAEHVGEAACPFYVYDPHAGEFAAAIADSLRART